MSTLTAQQAFISTVRNSRQRLLDAVHHAAHLLPSQGPIGVFIHHNTLHAFQHLPFEEAVVQAASVYGARPFMTEAAYREQVVTGRISPADIAAVVQSERNASVIPDTLDRHTLRSTLLSAGPRVFDAATVQWHLEETDFLRACRPDLDPATRRSLLASGGSEESELRALFGECAELAAARAGSEIKQTRGDSPVDPEEHIHPLLIRLCGAFLDQGMAYWPMPNRELGFLKAVRALLSQSGALFPAHFSQLSNEFRKQTELDAGEVVLDMFYRLGIAADDYDAAVRDELLELPGWAGMMHRLEQEPELAPYIPVSGSLMQYLAVRLTLKVVASEGLSGAESRLHASPMVSERSANLARAAYWFEALQVLGIGASRLRSIPAPALSLLLDEIEALDESRRRRLLHLAYERNHEDGILKPLATYRQSNGMASRASRPAAQVFFCIDEREESMRRHVEELAPDMETHGAAGFFGLAIDYAGIDDAHGVALCPVVVKPRHAVRERPIEADLHLHRTRRQRRNLWSRLIRHLSTGSRSLLRGGAGASLLGLFAIFPLLLRVLAPLHYGRIRELLHGRTVPNPRTSLDFVRAQDSPRTADSELLQGFSTAEKLDRVAGLLGAAGLREGFARLVVVLGHGSTSLNNPHESAHDCGACGGRRGGPNGRLFAAAANHPAVRAGLEARGIHLPADTWFIGGYHDTCDDTVDLYDLDAVPETHRAELQRVNWVLNRARALDAEERARRFEAASPFGGPDRALLHVQDRAEQLSEPRPEYGHCTNAVCVVGRRGLTKGLFMDRRAFLVSYDATQDSEDESLARLLGAVVPVCAGINLEYYFSFVDNERYGCGTKLPHNVTGLIGIMNGPESDLRTGLPWQMVEIHEPVRILFVIESTPERVMRVFTASAQLAEFLENRWIRLATVDPETGDVHVRRGRHFEKVEPLPEPLPNAAQSSDWFGGKLHHLPLAHITGLTTS